MTPRHIVIYDACVLYPAPLRSFLMYLALTGLFRACWSDAIHDEWIRNLLANRPDLRKEDLMRVRTLMDSHVPGAVIRDYERLIPTISLPDRQDRHVVAAAVQAHANFVVTFNLKHFPDNALVKYNLKAVHPDAFIVDMMKLDSATVVKAARYHRASLKNPPFSASEFLDCLQRQQLPATVSMLKPLQRML